MRSSLAVVLSIATATLVSAEITILGCLSPAASSSSKLLEGKGETIDECSTSCFEENAWFSAFEPTSQACKCSHTIPSLMTRGSEGCTGAGSIVSVIRPALISTISHEKPVSAKRKQSIAKPTRQGDSEPLCRPGLMACNLNDFSGYECLDVSSDPYSCGGCAFGEYGVSPSTTGTDCSAMPGADRDAVLCISGSCLASSCQKGYRPLSDGTCVWI